jgi:hypothetical protein
LIAAVFAGSLGEIIPAMKVRKQRELQKRLAWDVKVMSVDRVADVIMEHFLAISLAFRELEDAIAQPFPHKYLEGIDQICLNSPCLTGALIGQSEQYDTHGNVNVH